MAVWITTLNTHRLWWNMKTSNLIRTPNEADFGYTLSIRTEGRRRILGRCFYSPPYVVNDFDPTLPELAGNGKETLTYYLYEDNDIRGVTAEDFMLHFGIDPKDEKGVNYCHKETEVA